MIENTSMTTKSTASADKLTIFERITQELLSWPGVTQQPHGFGGVQFDVDGREMGHVHGNWLADLPFPKDAGLRLIQEGRACPHHVLPESGWISCYINNDSDKISNVIDLFRLQYDRLVKNSSRKSFDSVL